MATIKIQEAFTKLKSEITKFATAVGKDQKQTKESIGELSELSTANKSSLVQAVNELFSLVGSASSSSSVQEQIQSAISALRNELLGEGADEALDTLKEIGDKLKELEGDESVSAAILQKFTEVNKEISDIKEQIKEFSLVDFEQIYNTAKQGE